MENFNNHKVLNDFTTSVSSYEYNNNQGDLIKITKDSGKIDMDTELASIYKFEYKYDNMDNWIEKVSFY